MAGPGMNILPQYQGDYYTLQNKQALAQALMQQSLQPQQIQATGSGPYTVMPKYSMGAGIAQLGQALLAAKMQQQASQGLNALGQNQMDSLAGTVSSPQQTDPQQSALAQGAASGSIGPTTQNAALAQALAQQPATSAPPQRTGGLLAPGSAMNPSGRDPQTAAFNYLQLGPEKYSEQFVAPYYKPTDSTLMGRQAGLTPQQIQGANAGALTKSNFIAPITGTGTFREPITMKPVAYNASDIPGTRQLYDAAGNSAGVAPLQGAQAAMQGNAAATAAGSAQYKPVQVYNPQTQQMEYSNEAAVTNPSVPAPVRNNNPGAMMPGGKLATYPDMQTGLAALDTNLQSYGKSGVNTIAGVIGKWAPPNENDTTAYIKDVSQRLGIAPNQKIDLSNPLQRQALSTAISLHENGSQGVFGAGAPAASAPLGAQTGAEKGAGNLQDELSKKWTGLSDANTQAQTTTSYLQNIKALAGKAAIGPQSDKLNFVNGLLSLAGSEKATDAVTANNLLDKYSNQIVARLGMGDKGSDSARAILQSAYPNAHMTPQAINEAADNLVGASQMTQAKARLLAPLANARNATDYNNMELKFDQNADPRIFQYANIQDPAQRQAFAKTLIQQDPKIVQKIKTLESMGALGQ